MGRFLESMWCVAVLTVCFGIAVIGVGCSGESAEARSGFRVEGTEAGDCEDNADNDADGLFDCADPGCAGSSVCAAEVDGGIGGIGGNTGGGGMAGMAGMDGTGGTGGTGGIDGNTGGGGMAGMAGMDGTGGTGGIGGNAGTGGIAGEVGMGGASGTGGMAGVGGAGGSAGTGGTGGVGSMGGMGGAGGIGGSPVECLFIECDGRVTRCGDCMDNDGDGLIDNDDPECLGPCDNYEGEELLSWIGGETGEQCKADCYFDFGNGAGNDDCHWSRSCDPLEPKVQCIYDENKLGGIDCPVTQSQLCEDVCMPLTPNGCDCFGCCTFPELAGQGPGGGDGYVYIGSEEGCTFNTVTDPARCKACTPAPSCMNTCERCEVCLGKPTIPADCFPGSGGTGGSGGGDRCPIGKQECGLAGDEPCQPGSFCLTGCCTEIIVQ